MRRRSRFIAAAAMLAITVPTAAVLTHESRSSPVAAATAKPNILVVMTDDMRHDDLRYMPKLRAFLGPRATDFRNSFAPTPLCCPNRASFLTGKYAHNHHVWWHKAPWGYGAFDDRVTIGTAMQAAGYKTGYVGKYLNRYGEAKPKADPTHYPATYVPNGWNAWRGTPDATGLPASDPREGGTYRYYDTTINNNGTLQGHPGDYNSHLLVNEGIKLVDRFQATSRPWYLMVNSLAPHHGGPVEADDPYLGTPARPGWVKGKFNAEITRGHGIPSNGRPESDLSDKAPINRKKPATFSLGTRHAIRDMNRQRAEALYVLDQNLQRLWDKLRATGELSNTVIVFTSDNGYMSGEHQWDAGKVIGYEESYRVPLLVAGPGVPRGVRNYAPVMSVDVTKSLLSWGGATLRGTDGRSFRGRLDGHAGWDQALGYEAYFPGVKNTHPTSFTDVRRAIGIRTARYFYVRYADGGVELFDLAIDPVELKSVAKDPAYSETRKLLNAVWWKFKDCRGAECQIPLPPGLAASQEQTERLRVTMARKTAAYYG
jgi:N-acetylglucosamine-6-sulfatase